ncbi:MAG: hypothetical protein ACE5MK_12495 [Acidobacteriota bacterium]
MKNKTISILTVLIALFTLLLAQREGSGPKKDAETTIPAVVLNRLDPVSLAGGKEEKGKESFSAVYGNYKYYFASDENQSTFKSDPGEYAVRDEDPVAKIRLNREIKGKADIFAVHQGHIYLFASPEARDTFKKNPEKFIKSQKREGSGRK